MVAFGYRNGVAALMTALQQVFGEDLLNQVLIYIDDNLLPGRTVDEHLELLDKVLAKLE